jgi:hypothetical protein
MPTRLTGEVLSTSLMTILGRAEFGARIRARFGGEVVERIERVRDLGRNPRPER